MRVKKPELGNTTRGDIENITRYSKYLGSVIHRKSSVGEDFSEELKELEEIDQMMEAVEKELSIGQPRLRLVKL